jgi:hypothetical protein
MSSIDILYTQIFQKSKRCALESRTAGKLEINKWISLVQNIFTTQCLYLHIDMYDLCILGLDFTKFIEAFFLLAQRKHSTSCILLDSVTELIDYCIPHLDLITEQSA